MSTSATRYFGKQLLLAGLRLIFPGCGIRSSELRPGTGLLPLVRILPSIQVSFWLKRDLTGTEQRARRGEWMKKAVRDIKLHEDIFIASSEHVYARSGFTRLEYADCSTAEMDTHVMPEYYSYVFFELKSRMKA
jgi:hypothetical protein